MFCVWVLTPHDGVITPLIYSKHEISDCDRRCCQNMKRKLRRGDVLLFVLRCQTEVQGNGVIPHKCNELKTSWSGPSYHATSTV